MMKPFAARLLADRTGSTATEYALVAAMIAVSIAASVAALGEEVSGQYDGVEQEVAAVTQ